MFSAPLRVVHTKDIIAGMLSSTSSDDPTHMRDLIAVDSISWSSTDPLPSWDLPPAACDRGPTCYAALYAAKSSIGSAT